MTLGITNKFDDRKWRMSKKSSGNRQSTKNFALVEKIFFLSKIIRQEVNFIREEQGYYQSGHKEGGGSSNHAFISDPTSQIAIKRSQLIKSVVINSGVGKDEVVKLPELWLYVIDTTLNEFPADTLVGKILRARYIENEPQPTTCINLNIEPNNYYKYYNARTEGIQFAKECAIQLGLLKVI